MNTPLRFSPLLPDSRLLSVALAERSYPIYIGPGLMAAPAWVERHVPGRQVCVLTNTTVAPLYLQRVEAALAGRQVSVLVLPDGEAHKSLEVLSRVYDHLVDQRLDRNGTLVALGGGVIGDLTGFAAATFLRGVHFIQLPTTLLAQVDASVGGKTAVNHPAAKNLIGAFYQPRCVVADVAALETLPGRELAAGLAEIIKHALLEPGGLFDWLERHMERLVARDPTLLMAAVERACGIKAAVVAADEREAGQRALLNLGHTFGHAIEAGLGYGHWLHGEAVGAGLCMAARLSERLGWLEASARARIEGLVVAAGLPSHAPPDLGEARFRELMALDKKVLDGALRLVLLRGIGAAEVTAGFDAAALDAQIAWEVAHARPHPAADAMAPSALAPGMAQR